MIPLRADGFLSPSRTDASWKREPLAVGIGPTGETWAVWTAVEDRTRRLVTSHTSQTEPDTSTEISTGLDSHFVQPLPDGKFLTVSARKRHDHTAQVWDGSGVLVREGDFGDAIEHVFTTPTGAIWVGYFDEALGGTGPQAHGMARFDAALQADWLYPFDARLPPVVDSYALNVCGEVAWLQAYAAFHLVRLSDGEGHDFGSVPREGAGAVLVDGDRGALIGGFGAEYDLVTPIRLTNDGIEQVGNPRRLVFPDGLEMRGGRVFCRGTTMHVVVGTAKFRIDLKELLDLD